MSALLAGSPNGKHWFHVGIQDANPIIEHPTWFQDGYEFLYFADIGYTPTWEQRYTRSLQVGGYFVDERKKAGVPEGWGVWMSGQYRLDGGFQPFFRIGYADGGAGLYRVQATAGAVWSNQQESVRSGFALSYQDPMVRALRAQTTAEAFVRLDLLQNVAVKGNLQIVFDPALNPGTSTMIVPGISARLEF